MFLLCGRVESLVQELIFTGGRGNGKSDVLIMSFLMHVGQGWGAYWRGIILRQEYKHLADLVKTSHQLIPKIFPDATWSESKYQWTFATGEVLIFGHLKKERDYDDKFHGHAYQFVGWDELCSWSSSACYEAMMSCLRTAYIPGVSGTNPNMPPLMVRSATNPYGIGRHWVYQRFIEGKSYGEITYNEDGSAQRAALFGTIAENHHMDDRYIENYLKKITDPGKLASWLLGDWHSIDSDAMFGRLWSQNLLLEPFQIPANWYVDRCFDYAYSSPFATLWVAEANGEEVLMPNGDTFCPPAGSLIVFAEDYGTEEDAHGNQVKQNAPLNLTDKQIARRILEKEKGLLDPNFGLLALHKKVNPGCADNQIFNGDKRDQNQAPSVAKQMADEGLKWERSDKSPGSRVQSAQLMLSRLYATKVQNDDPQIYFFKTCKYSIKTIPFLLRDDKQLDSVKKSADDHLWDALAYRLTYKRKPKTKVQYNVF